MNTVDLTPLYRSSVGFDQLASLIDSAFRADNTSGGYPPYNIEVVDDNKYEITIAVSGFSNDELDIEVENQVLTVTGRKEKAEAERRYLHRGIAARAFQRKFSLADYVEIKSADLANGLLSIELEREIPDVMKPRKISIGSGDTSGATTKVIDANTEVNTEKVA